MTALTTSGGGTWYADDIAAPAAPPTSARTGAWVPSPVARQATATARARSVGRLPPVRDDTRESLMGLPRVGVVPSGSSSRPTVATENNLAASGFNPHATAPHAKYSPRGAALRQSSPPVPGRAT